MLYDPKWEQKTKKTTLADFVAWLETKNPNENYNYLNCDGACLIDQFIGHRSSTAEYARVADIKVGKATIDHVAMRSPQTFGAALSRIRALNANKQTT